MSRRRRGFFGGPREAVALWVVFVVAFVVLGLINLTSPSNPYGDVTVVYAGWVNDAVRGVPPGIASAWVYPVVALVPMLAASVVASALGSSSAFGAAWLVVVFAAIAPLLAWLTAPRRTLAVTRSRRDAAWFLVAFVIALGPVSIGRIDAITLPVAVAGLLALRRRPAVAGALLALGAWIKVWPAAPFLAAFIGRGGWRARMRLAGGGAMVTGAVVLVAALLGGGPTVLSFVTEQTGRGLQIEAPAATVPMLLATLGAPGYSAGYDLEILTFQITGPGTAAISAATTPVMAVLVLAVAVLGVLARRAGASWVRVVPPLALSIVLALILTNKVGSPQFVVWIGAVLVAWLVLDRARAVAPAAGTLAVAALTQVIYPWNYDLVSAPTLAGVVFLVLRNALYVVLFVVAVRALVLAWRDARGAGAGVGAGARTRARASRIRVADET